MNSALKLTLDNGLTVHIKEIHNAPIVSHWVWYRVGSRNEPPRKTGLSHWVEHMQFKGTPKNPASVLDKVIARVGGVWNAFTHLDWTTYFETLPVDQIELALSLEADRMINSLFDLQEVESERTVILSEREGNENEPLFRLGEVVQSTAFATHPYGHEVIGNRKDLVEITREDLFRHYQTYYSPSNALVAIAGDFEAQEMLEKINNFYGCLPAINSTFQGIPPSEPPAAQEQRVVVNGPGETTFMQITYHAPAAGNPDFFAFTVLDSLLSGPTSLNMFGGGGISNKTSRLYRSLVENELAVSVHGGLQATIDPYLYDIHITVHPRGSSETLLTAFDNEIKRLQDSMVTEAEIKRAIKQARALFAYGSENITNQAFWLGYAEMFAAYDWFTGYVDHLDQVTPQDIERIARTYLLPSNRVIGVYLPTGAEAVNDQDGGED